MRGGNRRFLRCLTAIAAGVAALVIGTTATAIAPAAARESSGSSIVDVTERDSRKLTLTVHSESMDLDIPVDVQRPADASAPRPVLYLLLGAAGGVDGVTWATNTHAMEFLADKNVNVVTPIGGMFSYYTDWERDDPRLGRQKWKTFLTQELPPLIDDYLGTNGRNAIAGYSMSATSTLSLAATTGDLYSGAAAYSGCVQTSDPIGQEFVHLVVDTWGLSDARNMWGGPDDPQWALNDPYVQAEGLRGKALYLSSGNGLPGVHDTYNGEYSLDGPFGYADQLVLGGVIESAVNYCTQNLRNRLDSLGIPAQYHFPGGGTHSWGYWEDALRDSWPVLAGSIGL